MDALIHDTSFTQSLMDENSYTISDEKLNGISCESLSAAITWAGGSDKIAIRTAHRLKQIFGDASIFMVIRNQQSMIKSVYNQYLAEGVGGLSFADFVSSCRFDESPFKLERLQYDRLITCYQSVFGKDRVLVLPYEMMLEEREVFFRRFEEFCGIHGYFPKNEHLNISNNVLGVLLLRSFNKLFSRKLFYSHVLWKMFRRIILRSVSLSKRLPLPKPKFIVDPDQLSLLYNESNKRTESLIGMNLDQYGYYW